MGRYVLGLNRPLFFCPRVLYKYTFIGYNRGHTNRFAERVRTMALPMSFPTFMKAMILAPAWTSINRTSYPLWPQYEANLGETPRFAAGDKVSTYGSGTAMTVEECDGHLVGCSWQGKDGTHTDYFDESLLFPVHRVSLRGRDLSCMNLLHEVRNSYGLLCILPQYDFTDSDLRCADFSFERCAVYTGFSRFPPPMLMDGVTLFADFTRADLRSTDFTGVRFHHADFTDTKLCHTFTAKKWQDEGLMPVLPDGGVLIWKHVVPCGSHWAGNLDYPYELGQEFRAGCMGTAGPMGALQDWTNGDTEPHVMAIAAHALYDFDMERGIYTALHGTPLAVYKATNIDGDECELTRVAGTPGDGMDPLALLGN